VCAAHLQGCRTKKYVKKRANMTKRDLTKTPTVDRDLFVAGGVRQIGQQRHVYITRDL